MTRHEVIVTWTSTPGTPVQGTVTVAQLINSIPGGSSLWDFAQFKRFDIYGSQHSAGSSSNWPTIAVTLNNEVNSNYFGDVPTFYSDPVGNSRRAHVGIVPNKLFTEAWIPSASTATLLTITTDVDSESSGSTGYTAIVQFTVQLRSTAGSVVKGVSTEVRSVVDRLHQVAIDDAEVL